MNRIVCIRKTVTSNKKQSALCSGYIRNAIQQSQFVIHSIPTQLTFLTTSYIFASIKDKYLRRNKDLKVFSYKKPKSYAKLQIFFYREIGIDKMDGPYWCSDSDEYNLDVTFHGRSDIYSISLAVILSEKNQFKLHEYIAYNQWKYSPSFVEYWQSICHPVLLPIPKGAVLFVQDEKPKYIDISWLPTLPETYCYPGYESKVAICGGKEINIHYKYNMDIWDGLHYVNDVMWYVELGEKYDIIATNASEQEIMFAIKQHQLECLQKQMVTEKEYKSQQSFKVGLKKIYRNLKLNKYGEIYNFAHKYTGNEWDDYLENQLNANNIHFTSTGATKQWDMLIAEGSIVFGDNYFLRKYNNVDKEIVYLAKMKFKFNTKSGYLRINAIRLKRNMYGNVDGRELLAQHENDYFSLLSVVNDSILYLMLDYLNAVELTVLQNVSMEFEILCLAKLHGESYAKLWCEINL